MITAYVNINGALRPHPIAPGEELPVSAVWIDLLSPTPAESHLVEHALGLEFPTKEEMREIEISSRLYQEDGAFFLTATLITKADSESPESVPATFVLAGHRLITLRHAESQPFRAFAAQVARNASAYNNGEAALTGLLDAIVDRIADILERIQTEVDGLSHRIFSRNDSKTAVDFEDVLKCIGRYQALTAKARESLVSLGRLLSYLGRPSKDKAGDLERNVRTIARDVMSLSDHATYLSNNISFLLETTLGLISIEQSSIIKIFSVAAVVFLPPTLIASIYGMNFEIMPELAFTYGYPISLGVMVLSAILPYLFFKYRGWL